MFTTTFGFTFLLPVMAKNQVQQQSSVFEYPATKSLVLSPPVCFLYCFLKSILTDKTHSPKGKLFFSSKGYRWFQVNK